MSMSGSPQQQVKGREIPSKRFILNDLAQLPHDYSTTPGGSIFSTTPGALIRVAAVMKMATALLSLAREAQLAMRSEVAETDDDSAQEDLLFTTSGLFRRLTAVNGTRIFYDRSFLLQCRNSPLTKSPPPNMAKIPGVTAPGQVDMPKENGEVKENHGEKIATETTNEDEAQFEMDI